jgi:4-diphosphocytidyl-2C-methyl-D-erythritol kinase
VPRGTPYDGGSAHHGPAKINLFLRILARETSGFHQIETAFSLLELADQLEVRRINSGVQLTVDGPDLGPTDENLAVRAARAVLDATGNRFGVSITLTKQIAVRAGLGGGSSDAAAALHAVNALAGNAVPRHELLHFAAKLGADVAFFASGAPLAVAWGRGERLFRIPAPPALPVLLAIPPISVATPDAYKWWDEQNPAPRDRRSTLRRCDGEHQAPGRERLRAAGLRPARMRTLYERIGDRPGRVRLSGSRQRGRATAEGGRAWRGDAATGVTRQRLIPTMTRRLLRRGALCSAPASEPERGDVLSIRRPPDASPADRAAAVAQDIDERAQDLHVRMVHRNANRVRRVHRTLQVYRAVAPSEELL